jgi:tRNA-modifying protein YgfZ
VTPTITGNPFSQQRDFLRGSAVCDVSHFSVLAVSGPDRLTWLNSLISQDVLGLVPGGTKESLILDPHGHVEHAFLIADDGETSWLLEEPGYGEALAGWLSKMVFRMQVTISNETGNYLVVASSGADTTALGEPRVSWDDPWPTVQPGSIGYSPENHPGEGWSLRYELFDRENNTALAAATQVDRAVLDALAIAAGRPMLADSDDKALPHEFDWLRSAVHLNKGCYRGQETVAKVHNLGHPPRRLTLLHLDGSGSLLPTQGDPVMLGEKEVGRITRAAWHYELGPIALALVKRSVDATETLTITTDEGHVAGNQQVLVSPDAGATRDIPRIPRLGRST